MAYAKDLTGRRFGRLVVVSRNYDKQEEVFAEKKVHKAFWNCICDCGNEVIVNSSNLCNRTNPTMSCGCLKNEVIHKQKNTKSNEWILRDDIAIGITYDGKEFIIDKEDYEIAKQYCWHITKSGYVVANSKNGSNRIIWLHRLLMNVKSNDIYVDHRDWDKSNNRKKNLRVATKSENNINIKRKSNNTSGYTGVTFNKRSHKYIARISRDGKRLFLGSFDNFEDAVKVRHSAEIALHGKWSGEINRKDYERIING